LVQIIFNVFNRFFIQISPLSDNIIQFDAIVTAAEHCKHFGMVSFYLGFYMKERNVSKYRGITVKNNALFQMQKKTCRRFYNNNERQ